MKNSSKSFLKFNLLNNLKSPSFYIVAVLFSVFVSVNFFIRYQFFTGKGSADLLLYFTSVPYICILAIPALCYKQSFSVFDNFIPLKNFQKVILKFLTIFILFAVMVLFLLPGTFLVNIFGDVDFGQVFTSIICLLFYGAAVISVCIFINEIFDNRVSALIVSAIVLAVFNSAHLFAVYVNLGNTLTSLFKQLSFAWHFDAASKGIIDTRDILWLAGSCILFLVLATFVIDFKKGKKLSGINKFRLSSVLLISFLIMLNGTRWYTRIDLSKVKIYSPSSYTKELVSKVQLPVKITYYRSSKLSDLYPQIRDVSDFLTTYASLNKNISLIMKDPDKDKESAMLLQSYGIRSQQIRTVTNNSAEFVNVYSAIIIEYNGNAEVIPFVMTADTLEYDLDGRIKHLITGIPRIVNIIVGNGMDLYKDYGYLVPLLNAGGFICNYLSPDDPDFTVKLSATSGPLFVIGDSKIKINEATAIESYILEGKGNALFTVSPYSSDIESSWNLTENEHTNIVEIIENWGVTFTPKIAADISCARITMYTEDQSDTRVLNYPMWINILPQENATSGVTLFWPTPLELHNENAKPLLLTTPGSYYFDVDRDSPSKLVESNPFVLETVNIGDKEKKTQVVGAEITGPLTGLYNYADAKDSHIIVIPDQYFVNSLMMGYIGGEYGDYRNFDFVTSILLKLNGEEELAELQSRGFRDTTLYKISDGFEINRMKIFSYVILFVVIPLIYIIAGVLFNVRKNKNKTNR